MRGGGEQYRSETNLSKYRNTYSPCQDLAAISLQLSFPMLTIGAHMCSLTSRFSAINRTTVLQNYVLTYTCNTYCRILVKIIAEFVMRKPTIVFNRPFTQFPASCKDAKLYVQ